MIRLFHGSFKAVPEPDVCFGRRGLDFGAGFYLTRIESQAIAWAKFVAGRKPDRTPILNIYAFDSAKAQAIAGLRYKVFPAYNLEWLRYVIDCRAGGNRQKRYDVVEGGVADDRVIDTVEDFEKGIITARQALGQLRYKAPNHQLAILSQTIIDSCLRFERFEFCGG